MNVLEVLDKEGWPDRENALFQFLNESVDGKIVLKTYIDNEHQLTNPARNLLARTLIRGEKDTAFSGIYVTAGNPTVLQSFRIPPERLDNFATLIEDCFPGECTK